MMAVHLAAKAWGAGVVRPLRLRENEVYEIAFPSGERAALRLHRLGYQTKESIGAELWWCAALADAGQPVPRPMPSLAGDLLYTLDDGRLVSVVSWVEGQPLGEAGVRLEGSVDDQVQRHFLLGQLVASIHAATDLLVLPDGFQRHSWDRDGLVGESPVWGRFWDRPNLSSEDRKTLIWARDFLAEALIASQSPTGLIHADVLRENVFVGPGGLSLLDFDDSGFGYRWYDLGTVLSQNLKEPGYEDIRKALIQGYDPDNAALADEIDLHTLARCCASVGWASSRLPPDDPVQQRHLDRAIALAQWVRYRKTV